MTLAELFGFVALMALGLILLFAIRVRLDGLQSRIAAVARLEAKLDLLLKQANIKFDPLEGLRTQPASLIPNSDETVPKLFGLHHYRRRAAGNRRGMPLLSWRYH